MVKHLLYGVGIVLLLFAVYASQRTAPEALKPHTAEADSVESLSGYAWSDTIGWISFSGATYKVELYTNPNQAPMPLVGYAWSDSIGWIRFGGVGSGVGNLGTPPASTYTNPEIRNDDLVGWVRACSVFQSGCSGALKSAAERGGWDGWISLSSLNGGGGTYGVKVGIGTFAQSYAWGSEVVGYVDMDAVDFSTPCVVGDQCIVGSPDQIEHTDQFCHKTYTNCNFGYSCQYSSPPVCELQQPAGTFTASPVRVRKDATQGGTTTFTWDVRNISSCDIATLHNDGTKDQTVHMFAAAGAAASADSVINYETKFGLFCTDVDGVAETKIGEVKIGILPALELF